MGKKTSQTEGDEKGEKRNEDYGLKQVDNEKNALRTDLENGFTLSDEDKKRKKKRHDVSCDDVGFSDVQDVILEGNIQNDGIEIEKNRGKKKIEEKRNEQKFVKAGQKDRRNDNEGAFNMVEEALKATDIRKAKNINVQKNDQEDLESSIELEATKETKKKHRENKNKGRIITTSSVIDDLERGRTEKIKGQRIHENEEIPKVYTGEDANMKKNKDKRKRDKDDDCNMERMTDGEEIVMNDGEERYQKREKKLKRDKDGGHIMDRNNVTDGEGKKLLVGNIMEKAESSSKERKKKQKKMKNHDGALEALSPEISAEEPNEQKQKEFLQHEGDTCLTKNVDRKIKVDASNDNCYKKKMKKKQKKKQQEDEEKEKNKTQSIEIHSDEQGREGVQRTRKDDDIITPSEKSRSKDKTKRVSFNDHPEVFPLSDGLSNEKYDQEDGLVRGKRFSPQEDEMVKDAVLKYIEAHRLGEEGLEMVLYCKSHPETRHCWKEIAAALPWRPHESVYYRAHTLFQRSEKRQWTPKDYEDVRNFHEKHGSDWKKLAVKMGKHRIHVKDTWRRIKLRNTRKGHWSQDEYQNLFDLVNVDLYMKALQEKKSKHGMLRDNISWEAISDKLLTRASPLCCMKWYDQLTSPMVAEGKWSDTDDYRLLIELNKLDACCMEEVDWDNLLEHRSGDICRKRWGQMVKHLGAYGNKSFAEQVEVLSNRYCPDVLEPREIYESKPHVP
ncbi:myb family transcription factor family protein [Tripterygium wilfordii]|uniref:Myb family transcription factor family protein n=1 Tax=Tripterygium wilfordii TaxID=458696 RepID=A0A7J7DZ55_TRIWF|nr:transcription termination factor 1-like [Tripterygium wilfordii]XP_038723608.1 transcription termination factor 1-like [Tripterygium wilfordii]KAF5751559.1 myb family transcription factor family protein [Tripterygium wilfordii]